jgi:hypothetical protein
MVKRIRRTRGRPASGFANQSEVNEADVPALSSATGREEGRPQDEPLSDFEAEVQDHLQGARPMSEITARCAGRRKRPSAAKKSASS